LTGIVVGINVAEAVGRCDTEMVGEKVSENVGSLEVVILGFDDGWVGKIEASSSEFVPLVLGTIVETGCFDSFEGCFEGCEDG
jgi:hypothetical protein